MKLTKNGWLRIGRLATFFLVAMVLTAKWRDLNWMVQAQAVSTTTVQGTVYLANGQAGAGTLVVSWPTFTTAAGQLVTADSTTVTIPADGFVSVNLAPNQGSTPAGEFYTAVYYMSDGSSNTQYWVVPEAAQATLAQVQAQVMPAAQAVQTVSKSYVDQSITELTGSLLTASGGTLSGPLYLNGDPTQSLQAATKHYVDTQVATAVPLAGGNMTGALQTPAVNGVEAPTAASAQTTLQAAMNAAGANGAMQIPPTYTGTDTFTNPNGLRVTDLRTGGSQQLERSVKEFGAVCDRVTDDTNALQAAINYAQTHGVALTIPEGTCKTHSLNWHGESIGGLGKQVSALMGFPGQDVLATVTDSPNLLSYTRLHDMTIYVDQSMDMSCSAATGRAPAGSCQMSRQMEGNSIFSPGGNGLAGTVGTGAAWAVGNCAIAMPAATGTGGNGLKVAEIENLEIAATGTDPLAAQYPGAHSTHVCGMYLAQWPQWSEFRNIDMRGLNTGVAIPALPVTTPAGLNADSNRWQNVTIHATHGFTAAAGSNNVLDNVVEIAGNSAATGEPPTGLVLDLNGSAQGWTVRNAVVLPSWTVVQPALTVTAAGGGVTAVTVGTEHGLGFDPYGATVPLSFSGSCTAQASATVNSNGSIGSVSVTAGGVGCSATTTASVNVAGTWDTAAPVNLIGGQNMTFFAGNLLKGNGGYTVWNASGSETHGTQLGGGGGTLPGGGSYAALVGVAKVGTAYQVDQFPGADIGAKIQACLGAVSASYGGTCDARNFAGNLSMGSNLTISTGNTTVLLPCATIATSAQVIVTAGTRNVALRGCALRGGSAASGNQGGTVLEYSGADAMIQVGDPTYGVDTPGFHLDDVVINTTGATSGTAQGLVAYRTQEMDLESLYFLGNQNQTGMTLDGTGNYTGGTFLDNELSGFGTAVNGIGHQVANPATTDWVNASTFVRLHIDCPTSGGNPISGTYGVNLVAGDGNTVTGGDVEGCTTALHLGANAQNNTIVGLRNENSTNQVVADAGSQYNNWMTGGTMFTGKLTDNGTRNSFLDTFHRSFNGLNGDWYGSQQDATVTNHFRLGTGAGNERGLLNRYQTDYGYRWTMGLSDAVGGEQYYQILDELNNVYRVQVGQYNNGQPSTNNQTVINAAGTGAVVLNGSNNAGTGGVVFGSGGASESTVATISNAGNAQFNGTLQVGGTSQSAGTMTVRNNADAEVDYYLWPGLTASQKGSFTYKDWNGNSQWYLLKDASNNWALNSAIGGLDSFKAYQSSNSGDTYIDASNSTGHIRLNYETGSGAETDIYSGSSSSLAAAFLSPTSIKFPGLAAASGHYCMQIDNSGYITNTGSACGSGSGSGGSGTVSGLTANYVPLATGATAISSSSHLYENGSQDVFTQPVTANANNIINIMAPPYSAACNLTQYAGGSISTGSAILSGSGFTAAVVGQTVVVWNAGGLATNGSYAPLVSTVASYQSATQITLSSSASSMVSSGPFEIGSLDTTAIQGAYNAAGSSNLSVLIPGNGGRSCLTGPIDLSAGSTLNNPVPIHGQGSYVSSLTGLPGQDVLAWPDGRQVKSGYAKVDGLTIVVDTGLDVSSAAGGSATFPNRITGEIGNGSGGLAAASPAISPGPVSFTGGTISQSGDSTYDELTVAAANGGQFNGNPGWMTVGSPVTIPSLGINGTIMAVLSQTQIKFSPAYSAGVSGLSGTWGAGLTPPWYVGNCGIAFPASSGLNSGGVQMIFEDLNFQIATGNTAFGNHACAMFFQQPPYWARFQRITAQNFYYGYIEALPTSNNNITWTPDTSHYVDINISATIPLVQYGGNHRILDGISIYSANHPLGLGAFFFNGPMNSAGGSTVTHFYDECWSNNTGENQRWSGSQWTISGGSLTQCNGPYVNWAASQSFVTDTGIGGPNAPTPSTAGLQLSGSNNAFDQMYLSGNSANGVTGVAVGQVNDSGSGNRVSDTRTGTRVYAVNAPQPVSGTLDGVFAQTGNFGCSFASSADLFTRYNDWEISASGITPTYGQDFMTNDGNIAGSYLQLPANGSGGNIRINFWGSPMSVGYRMPQCGTINAVVYGEAPGGATTFTLKIYDQTTSTLLTSCNYSLTTGWAFHGQPGSADACTFSTSALAAGDLIDAFAYSSSTYAVNMGSLTFTPQTSNVLAQAFTPVGAGSRAMGTVSNFQVSATNPISNYVGGGYAEVESNGTCESVSQGGGVWGYSTATDPYCESWSTPTSITGLTGVYNPGAYDGGFSIAKSGSTYYMIVDNAGSTAGAGNLYLLSATALAGPWTVQNGGSPVLSAGTSISYTYYMYNPALAIVGSNWLLLIEGGSNTKQDGATSYSYATGCPTSCSFTANLTSNPVFGIGNGYADNLGVGFSASSPQFIYVPDKSAIVALLDIQRGSNSYLGAYTISSTSAPALATYSNWALAPGFQVWIQGLSSGGPSDPRLYFSPTVGLKGFNGILSAYTNTSAGTLQAYSPLTLDQWYGSIVNPATQAVPTWSNQNGTGSPLMSSNPYGPINFSVYPTSTFNPVYAVRGFTSDAGGAGTQSGLTGQANFQGAAASSTDTLRGVQGIVNQASSGYTLSSAEAGYFQVQAGGSGYPLTNGYGVYVDSANAGVATGYGLYIASQANATTHYGIYQAGSTDTNQLQGPTTLSNTLSESFSPNTTAIGISSQPFVTATSGTVTAIEGQPNFQTGSASSTGTIRGVAGVVTQNLSGYNLSNMEGGYFKASTSGSTYTATNAYAAYLDSTGTGVTNGYGLYIASQSNATNHWGIYQSGTTDTNYFAAPLTSPGIIPNTIYSAAGTALPICASGIKGERAVVSDATIPTYMGAYASGGAITAEVICSYNGSTYSWLTH